MEEITISLEKYIELLIIKGKYEELKRNFIDPLIVEPPYKITCSE